MIAESARDHDPIPIDNDDDDDPDSDIFLDANEEVLYQELCKTLLSPVCRFPILDWNL